MLIAVTTEEATRLFDWLKAENVLLFYVKPAVEFGVVGRDSCGERVYPAVDLILRSSFGALVRRESRQTWAGRRLNRGSDRVFRRRRTPPAEMVKPPAAHRLRR